MGWGLVFLGYLMKFLFGLNPIFDVVLALPACLVMLLGLKRLSLYCHTFHYALWSTALLAAVSVGGVIGALLVPASALPAAGAGLIAWLRYVANASLGGWGAWADMIAVVLFHAALALGIKDIAMRVGVQKNAVRAMRNLVLVGLYAACLLTASILPSVAPMMAAPATLICLVFAVCNCVLLYSCYMRIAPAEEVVTVRKQSRIGWVNRLRDAYDAKTRKAIEDDRAYHAQQASERREKLLARMSQKQRNKEELKQKRNQK